MRLNAQVKGGFYPAHPEAIAHVLDHVRARGHTMILDPCCGKGEAIHQIGIILGQPAANVHAIELDALRVAAAKQLMPGSPVMGPADFIGADISNEAFGFAWVNPPFDDELGGGQRVEFIFLQRATAKLVSQGVMCLVCPARIAERGDVQKAMMSLYRDIAVVPFPEDFRPFNEVAVLGIKRSTPVDPSEMEWDPNPTPGVYAIPPMGEKPRRFKKNSFTEDELSRLMHASKARKILRPPAPPPMPRPPLQLPKGQRALLLAGGFLNRDLQLPGQDPIVIKASPQKEEFQKSRDEEEVIDARGKSSTKVTTIISERIVVCVRVIDTDGVIHTLRS